MPHPRYFVAVFGDPKPPHKDVVESGVYHPNSEDAPFPVEPGDVMVLYCTGSYAQHSMKVPGLGIALHVDSQCIKYRWLPFEKPIPKAAIDKEFESEDAKTFGLIRFDHFWLFKISQRSFSQAVAAGTINWGNL